MWNDTILIEIHVHVHRLVFIERKISIRNLKSILIQYKFISKHVLYIVYKYTKSSTNR